MASLLMAGLRFPPGPPEPGTIIIDGEDAKPTVGPPGFGAPVAPGPEGGGNPGVAPAPAAPGVPGTPTPPGPTAVPAPLVIAANMPG